MNWIAYAIVLYGLAALQTTLAAVVEIRSVRPDLLLLAAAYYALAARPGDALLAGWLAGLVSDLCGMGLVQGNNVGVGALSFGLAAWVVVKARDLTFREHLGVYLMIVSGWSVLATTAATGWLAWRTGTWGGSDGLSAGSVAATAFWNALYCAFLAPYVHWLLRRFRWRLGLNPAPTYRSRG